MKPDKLLYKISPEWAVLNFLRIFETQIADYRHPKYQDKKQTDKIIEKAHLVTMKDLTIQRFSTRKLNTKSPAANQALEQKLQKFKTFKKASTVEDVNLNRKVKKEIEDEPIDKKLTKQTSFLVP